MNDNVYKCPEEIFRSYLAPAFASFVEYKVNVGGCTPESFLPVLTLFDSHCMHSLGVWRPASHNVYLMTSNVFSL